MFTDTADNMKGCFSLKHPAVLRRACNANGACLPSKMVHRCQHATVNTLKRKMMKCWSETRNLLLSFDTLLFLSLSLMHFFAPILFFLCASPWSSAVMSLSGRLCLAELRTHGPWRTDRQTGRWVGNGDGLLFCYALNFTPSSFPVLLSWW